MYARNGMRCIVYEEIGRWCPSSLTYSFTPEDACLRGNERLARLTTFHGRHHCCACCARVTPTVHLQLYLYDSKLAEQNQLKRAVMLPRFAPAVHRWTMLDKDHLMIVTSDSTEIVAAMRTANGCVRTAGSTPRRQPHADPAIPERHQSSWP